MAAVCEGGEKRIAVLEWRLGRLQEINEGIYGAVADILFQNHADDKLIAQMADSLQKEDSLGFERPDFMERAYGSESAHP